MATIFHPTRAFQLPSERVYRGKIVVLHGKKLHNLSSTLLILDKNRILGFKADIHKLN